MSESDFQDRFDKMLRDADARAIEVIRNRIEGLGIEDVIVQSKGEHRFHIQLPKLTDEQCDAVEKCIQHTGLLEFKLVHAQNDALVGKTYATGRLPEGYVMSDRGRGFKRAENYNELARDPDYAYRLSMFEVPDPRYAFMLERRQNADGSTSYEPIYVLRRAEMTGDALANASVERDHLTGRVQILLTFNNKGAADFAKLTKDYAPGGARNKNSAGRRLAIVLDNTLYKAPVIMAEIPDGRPIIEGNFSFSEANMLCNILNAGALPVPLKIIDNCEAAPLIIRTPSLLPETP